MDNKSILESIWDEFQKGQTYKEGIGDKGIHEQAKMNERFFVGDQWRGVNAGNDKPLTRRNIIKRIGEYKISAVNAAPKAVNYSADGVPDTTDLEEEKKVIREDFIAGNVPQSPADNAEISVVMNALSDYFSTTAERIKFETKLDRFLRNAYISGTGVFYTYWNDKILTGLYADENREKVIRGDIDGEILDIENVVFGDANGDEVEDQPYIIIARRLDIDKVIAIAEENKAKGDIKPDEVGEYYKNSGDIGEKEPENSRRVTVITKFFKVSDSNGVETVHGIMATKNVIIRPEWDLRIHRYPIAKFCWEQRRSCAYGDSEITYQIPNQIALNKSHAISVWARQLAGMPKLIVNGDIVTGDVSNDPGEIIKVFGGSEDVRGAMHYVVPPNFGTMFETFTQNFATNILTDAGATDAALGQIRPDNAAAIVQAREAATAPMQVYQNRYYSAIEDIARIWADFWITMYGKRAIKVKDSAGTRYLMFDAERYKNLVITAKIDVGASTLYSEAVAISNLGNLLTNKFITFEEYLERVPKGLIPDVNGLLASRKVQQTGIIPDRGEDGEEVTEDDIPDEEIIEALREQNPEAYENYMALDDEKRAQALSMMRGNNGYDGV